MTPELWSRLPFMKQRKKKPSNVPRKRLCLASPIPSHKVIRFPSFCKEYQSNFLAPSFMGPLAAFLSARLASISCLLSSRFFRASSDLLGPAGANTKQKHWVTVLHQFYSPELERCGGYPPWSDSSASQFSSRPQSLWVSVFLWKKKATVKRRKKQGKMA